MSATAASKDTRAVGKDGKPINNPALDASRKDPKAAGPNQLTPPEEQFWQRYSPHGEGPLSIAGSFALHIFFVGGLLLFGAYLASLFFNPNRQMPVDPVRLNLGGGGGAKHGVGDGKGIGHGPEDVPDQRENNDPKLEEPPAKVELNKVEKQSIDQKYDDSSKRFISENNTEMAKKFVNLDDNARRKLADGLQPGKGEGGSGSGGGSGTGTGKGHGSGTGDGKATLTDREKRMLRWHMRFTANSGPEYLGQLRGLGAILAFPVSGGAQPVYKIVEDLRPGGKLVDKDLSEINRIYWIDDKPQSVRDVLDALGIKINPTPARFVAFMPHDLEKQLFQMERSYVENVLRKKFVENNIDETQFKVVPAGGSKYKPELISVTMR